MILVREACPACGSQQFKKNGHIHNGKQNHQCKTCGRQFVPLATQRLVPTKDRTLVERLLCEKLSLQGICRVVGVSIRWLMDFVSARFTALPDHLYVQPATSPHAVIIQRLDVEADEMCSFVKKKANKQWLWLAMDTTTRQVIAFHVGDRSRKSAGQLWANIPAAYREQASFYTDQYEAYKGVIPAAQHQAITKKARKTNHIDALTTPYGNVSLASCVIPSPSPRNSKTTSGRSATSFAITTLREPQHYIYTTTNLMPFGEDP